MKAMCDQMLLFIVDDLDALPQFGDQKLCRGAFSGPKQANVNIGNVVLLDLPQQPIDARLCGFFVVRSLKAHTNVDTASRNVRHYLQRCGCIGHV